MVPRNALTIDGRPIWNPVLEVNGDLVTVPRTLPAESVRQ